MMAKKDGDVNKKEGESGSPKKKEPSNELQ